MLRRLFVNYLMLRLNFPAQAQFSLRLGPIGPLQQFFGPLRVFELLCCLRWSEWSSFRFHFSHFAIWPFRISHFAFTPAMSFVGVLLAAADAAATVGSLAYVFCCYMDLLLPFAAAAATARVVFNIICLSTCCGICSRQQAMPSHSAAQDNKDTHTPLLSIGLCSCFLSFELPFFSMSAFPFTTMLSSLLLLLLLSLSPSFLLERCKPLIFGYVFLHFCSLFAFDLIVGSALLQIQLQLQLLARAIAMCRLLTFNEMSTKDQALCACVLLPPISHLPLAFFLT